GRQHRLQLAHLKRPAQVSLHTLPRQAEAVPALDPYIGAAIGNLDLATGIVVPDCCDDGIDLGTHPEHRTHSFVHRASSDVQPTKMLWNGLMPASATVISAGSTLPWWRTAIPASR